MIYRLKTLVLVGFIFIASGCFKDLDTVPLDPNIFTSNVAFDNPEAYLQVLAKLYAGLAVSGQQGPSGQADISGIDEGFGQYLRGYWYHQQLTTDEAVIGWNDQTIKDFHNQSWSASDGFIYAFYSRIMYQISLANEYLRQTSDDLLTQRGVDQNLRNQIRVYRAEARFLRALSYWHSLDLFRNSPFATESDPIGQFLAPQYSAQQLFDWLENELKSIENELLAPRSNQYGRADRAAAWMLLAKLYLNAEVYTGQRKYNEAVEYCDKIIGAGYSLEPNYEHLFLTDNDRSNEIIFPIRFDGITTRTWGGMTFIISASIGGSMNPAALGMAGGWGGTRTTKEFVQKFPADLTGIVRDYNIGQTLSYQRILMPGTHNGFNGIANEPDDRLTAVVRNSNIFEGYRYFEQDNSEFVFLRNPSSALSGKLGDNAGNGTLQSNGANIVAGPKGLYYIRVNLSNNTYTLEKQDWVITGTATGGQELDLVYDPVSRHMVYQGDLMAGNFRFARKGDAANNLGDNAGNALLTPNGLPISIPESGGYRILLNLNRPDYTYRISLTSFDRRGLFYTNGQNLEIEDLTIFNEGYAIQKFKNISSTGQRGSDATFPDTDFPMFRLADVYLMAAEAILRGGGDISKAVTYTNRVRERAYTGTRGNVNASTLNLDFILDERARELYWECHRRTDLIRFGKFSNTNYLWSWKGGVKEGRSVEQFRDIFPIPSADLNANPNLRQNTGY